MSFQVIIDKLNEEEKPEQEISMKDMPLGIKLV